MGARSLQSRARGSRVLGLSTAPRGLHAGEVLVDSKDIGAYGFKV